MNGIKMLRGGNNQWIPALIVLIVDANQQDAAENAVQQ
jgi:hypothetical protein